MSKRDIVEELHRNARRNFQRRKTDMRGINDTLQADLVEMIPYAKQNRNMKYILTVINIFSKVAYARALKNKSATEVTKAMDSVLSSIGHPIEHLNVDNGKEFYNAPMKKMLERRRIHMYSTFTTKKAAIVERFNRSLKNRMWKEFSFRGSYKWIDILDSLVDDYNFTKHRTIKMRPVDVNTSNERYLLKTVYRSPFPLRRPKNKFKKGDSVRISKYKHIFAKGYTPNWTTEIFKIKTVQSTNPVTYLLVDHEGRDITGTVYAEELQSVKYPDLFLVEKVLRKKGDKVFVKWLGFESRFNSWINEKDVL